MTQSRDYKDGYRAAVKVVQEYTDLEIAKAIGQFLDDPADSDWQLGYLAALKARFINMQSKEHIACP